MSRTDGGGPPPPKPKVVKRPPTPSFARPLGRVAPRLTAPPKSPVKAARPVARKVVTPKAAPTRAPRTDVRTSGPAYGTKKAVVYQRTAQRSEAVKAGRKMVGVGTVALIAHHDEPVVHALSYATDTLSNIAQRLRDIGAPPDKGRMDRQGVAEVKKAATYAGDTGRNILRRLQHSPGGVQQASVLPIGRNDPVSKAAQNLPADVANTFVNAIPATAHIASEVAHGHVDQAGKQLAQPYIDIVKHPGKNLVEHPFSTAALVTGPLRGASRAAGAVARRGVLGDAAKSAASTERTPATVEGTKLVQPRRYSPDPVGKGTQVLKEKGKVLFTPERKAVKLRKKADKLSAQGQHAEAAALRDEAARHNPTRMHEDQVKKRVDVIRDVNEVVRRGHAQQVTANVHAAVRNEPTATSPLRLRRHPDAIKPTAAVSLVAQKIVYPTVADLKSYLAETERAYKSGDLTPAQRAANEELRRQINDALAHPQDMARVQQAADRYRAVVGPITKALERHKMLDPAETAKRVELPFAVRKLGAVRDAKPRLTEAGTKRLVSKFQVAEAVKGVTRSRRLEVRAANREKGAARIAAVSEARTKSSPILKALTERQAKSQGVVRSIDRQLRGQARRAGRREGRAAYTAAKADRAMLLRDKQYAALDKQSKGANIEKSQAAKAVRNATRNPGMYSPADLAKAVVRHDKAVAASTELRTALDARESEIRAMAARSVTETAGKKPPVMTGTATRGGSVYRIPANKAERFAKRGWDAKKNAAALGRRPVLDLAKVEAERARELALEKQRVTAVAKVAELRAAARVEAKRIKGVEPAKADKLLRAINERVAAAQAKLDAIDRLVAARKATAATREATRGKAVRRAPGFVDEHGRPFSGAQMRAERVAGATDAVTGAVTREPLPGDAAYVSHAPNIMRPGSFYKDSGRPVDTGNRAFTGGSVLKGTFDASEHAMHASARKLQSLLDAHEGHMAFLDETALRDQQGDVIHGDRTRVQAAIDKMTLDSRGHPLPGARRWRIVRTNPFGGRSSQLDELMHNLNDHGEMHSNTPGEHNPVVTAVEDALAGRGDGPFVAIPEEAAVRLEAHLKVLGNQTGQVWNVINTLWRKNVLAFSLKWAASNVGEAAERSLVAGVRPGDRALLLRTVNDWKKTDPAGAERFMASVGGGHYGFVTRNQRHATSAEFADPTRNGAFVRTAARIAGTVERTPVVNWLPKVYGAWTGHVMNEMGRVERQFRLGMAGKKLRDLTQQNREIADLSEKGLAQALHGLRGTPTQIEIANFARKAYGQYEAFSPKERAWIATYTPFLAWSKNAAVFLSMTLPRDHPVVTAMAAEMSRSQEPWLRSLGLWIGQPDSLPSYLMGDVPTPGGGLLKIAKYTPQSLLADPAATIAGLVLPSGGTLLMALRGLDPFGNPLKESKTSAFLKGLLGLVTPGPLAPRPAGSQSSLLDTLNPVQVIPGDKVRYARVKASLDRLNQKITAMPPAARAKQRDGKFKPEYQKLLDQRSALTNERHVLLVKAGYVKDPTLAVDQQIRQLRVVEKQLEAQHKAINGLGYATREYAAAQAKIAQLEKQRAALLPAPKRTVIKRRPLTTRQQIEKSITAVRKTDVRKQIEDEIKRAREQAIVNGGG